MYTFCKIFYIESFNMFEQRILYINFFANKFLCYIKYAQLGVWVCHTGSIGLGPEGGKCPVSLSVTGTKNY